MLLEIVSYNGTTLNDANFSAWFPVKGLSMPGASVESSPRSQTFPLTSSKSIGETVVEMEIECLGTIHSQLDTLKQLFAIEDYTFRQLIVKDTANSNKQWYLMAYAVSPVVSVDDGAGGYRVKLAVKEPFWRSVVQISDTWAISASGATKSMTILGNMPARLIFELVPNTAKVGGYLHKQWMPWTNPLAVANSEPLEITDGGINTTALLASSSNKCQINQGGGINASVTTIPYDTVSGTLPTSGMGYCGTEQISWTGRTGTTSGNLTGVTRGIGGTTAATHADNAEIKVSSVLANLNDVRVYDGPTELARWHSGIGSATKVWINITYAPKIEMTLQGTVAGSGSVATISVKKTAANLAYLKRLPARFIFSIGTEVFYGHSVNTSTYSFTVESRAAKGTSAAAHADGDVITWIEHDLYLLFGNQSAEAPVVNDTKKPPFNLSSSTNTSRVYAEFASDDGLRTGGWVPYNDNSRDCEIYTGSHGDLADPATEMGMTIKSYTLNGKPKPENALLYWQIYHPAGFIDIPSLTGAKRRLGTDWPAKRGLQKSTDGKKWVDVFSEASPSVISTWEALATHTSISLSGTYYYLRWILSGSVKAGTLTTANEVNLEAQAITTSINTSNVLQKTLITAEEDNYFLDATITVVVSSVDGDAIYLKHAMKSTETLTVDCDAEEITHNGLLINPIGWNSSRLHWLDVPTGSVTLRFDDTGTTALDIAISGEYRMAL